MDAFRTGLLAGYGIAIPVGAIAVLIVQVGSKDGFGRAFFAGAGAATADLIYATVALVGGAALAGVIDSAGEPLRFISAGVLAGIAITGLVRSTRPVATSSDRLVATSHGSTYAQFLGLTMINPSTVVYFAAVVVGLGVAETIEPGSGLAFVSGAFLASCPGRPSWPPSAVSPGTAWRSEPVEWRSSAATC